MAVTAGEDSVFAVRMGDYARRAAADSADRFLHGLAHLAVAAMAFPRPEDLADDGYIGRVTVNGVDAFVRQACRRLEERAEEHGENTDPATDAPGLEAAWRIYARRSATGATKDARRLAGSTTGIVGKAVAFLTDSGFLQRTGDDSGGTYRTTARYQLQVRDMAGSAAMAELLELGVVPVSDGTATLLPPPEDTDDLELAADAGLPVPRLTPGPSPSPDLRRPASPRHHESPPPCTSCPGSASTPSGPPVRATPTPCSTCAVSASPCPTPRRTQAEFFEEEPTGPPRRPAPAGVLFLENGGGKSVLLKLIFSVMLPGHRNTLGGASSGVLRKFLLADDCGHVALEWQHTLTGECVVVGKVSEWRGRQVSNDPRKFAEAWYSFRPGPGLSLDNLPVAEATAVRPPVEGASGAQGRRRTMKGFRDALTEAGKAYPHLDVHWEEIHDRWNEHLGDLGLDPELFRYQREMNADEGEAAGLFAVKKDSDFTDLLLRAVTDTRDTDGLADLVSGFGNKLGRRAELIAERDFTAGSVDLLGRIVEAAEARSRARDIHAGAERRTRTLARRLSARAAEERGRAADLAQRVTAAAHAVTARRGGPRAAAPLIAAELAYRHASLALTVAEKAAAAQRRELTDARTLHSAWQAAEAVLRHRAAADRSARVAAAIREAERDAAPALAARATAAVDLVRALHTAAEARRAARQRGGGAFRRPPGDRRGRPPRRDRRRHRGPARPQRDRAPARSGWPRSSRRPPRRSGPAGSTTPPPTPTRPAPRSPPATPRRPPSPPGTRPARPRARAAEHAREAAAAESRAELTAARAADAARRRRARVRRRAPRRRLPRRGRPPGGAAEPARTPAASGRPGARAAHARAPATARLRRPEPAPRRPASATRAADGLTAEELDRYADELRELLDRRRRLRRTPALRPAHRRRRRRPHPRRARRRRAAAARPRRPRHRRVPRRARHPGPARLALPRPGRGPRRPRAPCSPPAPSSSTAWSSPTPTSHARAREVLTGAALLPRSAVAVGTAAALLAPTPAPGPRRRRPSPTSSSSRRTRPCTTSTPPTRSGRRCARGPPSATRRSGSSRPGSPRTGSSPPGSASWRTGCPPGRLTELAGRPRGDPRRSPRRPRPSSPRPVPCAPRPTRRRPTPPASATSARRPPSAPAAPPTPSPDSPSGCASAPAGRSSSANSPTRPPSPRPAPQACLERARAADEDRRAAQRAADDARRTARALRAERAEIAGAPDDATGGGRGRRRAPPSRPCARPTAPPPSCTRRSASAPTCAPSRPGPRATRAPPLAELDRLTNKVRTRAAQLLEGTDGADGPSRQAAGRPRRVARAAAGDPRVHRQRAARPAARRGRAARPRGRRGAHRTARGTASRATPSTPRPCCAPPPPSSPPAPRRWSQARDAHAELLRAHRAAEDAAGGFDETAALLRDLLRDHTHRGRRGGARALPGQPWRRPASPPPRPAAPCAAAPPTSPPPRPPYARRATSSYGTPTPPATSRSAPPRASRSANCPPPRCPSTRRSGPTAFAPRLRVLTDELAQLERNRDTHRRPAARPRRVGAGHAALRPAAVPAAGGTRRVVRARSSCGSASRSPTRPRSPSGSARSSTRRPARP